MIKFVSNDLHFDVMQVLHGTAEDLTNTFPIGLVHSSANDDEEV